MTSFLQRRIAREIIVMFTVSLFALTFLVLTIGVAREAMSHGLGLGDVMRLIPYAAPNALSLAVPGTALFSVCCVYGRMSADNEFTALQAVGISPLPAIVPAIIITTLLSLLTVGLINTAFTWGFHGVERVVMSSVEDIAYGVLERDRSFQYENLALTVQGVEGKRMIRPAVTIRRSDKETISITAQEASMSYREETNELELSMTNGIATMNDQTSFQFDDTLVQTVALDSSPPYSLLSANPSHMPMSDLPQANVEQRDQTSRLSGQLAVQIGFSLLSARIDEVAGPATRVREEQLASSHKRQHRLGAEMQRRWASGFTCLALAFVGVPLAIRLKTADTMTTFGICFLPTLLVYYPLFALTLDMAKSGRLLAIGVWISNLIAIAIGAVMIRRTIYRPA